MPQFNPNPELSHLWDRFTNWSLTLEKIDEQTKTTEEAKPKPTLV